MAVEGTVLVVDDEDRIHALLAQSLGGQGFDVRCARNSAQAIAQLRSGRVDVVLLDLVLGNENGLVLLTQMRQGWPAVPVIVVSGVTDVEVRVTTLQRGAIDVVGKPFNLVELAARIRRHSRPHSVTDARFVTVGGLQLDVARRIVHGPSGTRALAEREVALLAHLMRRPGDVCTRQALLREVWQLDFDPGSNLVDVSIRRLRLKMPGLPIETVRGVGYCFVASERPVHEEPAGQVAMNGPTSRR